MITDLLSTIVTDVAETVRDASFFKDRSKGLAARKDYPDAFVGYLTSVSEADFASDMRQLVRVLGSSSSVLSQISSMSGNKLFDAYLDFVADALTDWIENPSGESRLATYMRDVVSGKTPLTRRYQRVLINEAQTLLLAARGIASANVQIAADVSAETKASMRKQAGEGVAGITVNPDLLGGARMFKNGALNDASWRARLNQIISVIS